MKGICLLLTLALFNFARPVYAGVHFSEFKFQPDKSYAIEIFHKHIMKFRFNNPDDEGAVPPERVIPLENQVLFKATLRTYPVTDEHVMPVKMYLDNFATLIKRGKQMIPQNERANNELKGKEYFGVLDTTGTITFTGGKSGEGTVPAGDASVFKLLDMIPALPAGKYEIGSVLAMDTNGKFVSSGEPGTTIALIYTILEQTGDEVHIDIIDPTPPRQAAAGSEELRPGTTGNLVYSLKDKICASVYLNTVYNSEPGNEELKEKGVVVNDRVFRIHVDVVE